MTFQKKQIKENFSLHILKNFKSLAISIAEEDSK